MATHRRAQKSAYFGNFGGQYVIETLMPALKQLESDFKKIIRSKRFQRELDHYLSTYVGRPTPLYHARRLTEKIGGASIYLKREDLTHTGAHKINNTVGQALLARRMGKKRVIAETGAGQHGVATATVAALFGLECDIYMGAHDMKRQEINLFKMKLLGARPRKVSVGSQTLKEATLAAMRDWIGSYEDTHYIIGSAVGPAPFPYMARHFQSVIGEEAKLQLIGMTGRDPDALVACVGGGSNAIGLFHPFYDDESVKMYGVEAAGKGLKTGEHGASLSRGSIGVLHGSKSYCLFDHAGQVAPTHSISAGLDYPGVGPEHAWYKETRRAEYKSVTDSEALDAFELLSSLEGIIPAFESAHALAYAAKLAKKMKKSEIVIVSLSGRGDKDIYSAAAALDRDER